MPCKMQVITLLVVYDPCRLHRLIQSHRMFIYSIQFDGDIKMLCGMEVVSKHATHCICILFERQQLQTCWLHGIVLWYLTKLK